MIDIRQTSDYANYLRSEGWIVEREKNINYFIRKFPIGAVLKLQRPEKIYIKKVNELSQKYHVFEIIIEPKNDGQNKEILQNGFKLSKNPFLPSKTIHIDLRKLEDEILKQMKKDARYAIKRGGSFKIKNYLSTTDIKKWYEAWKKSVNFKRFVPRLESLINLRKSFTNSNSLFLASHNISSRIIGGALFTKTSHENKNNVCYYWYGFTNSEGRTSLSQYSLLYHGILWAKKNGCKTLDLEGIYDPRFPNKSWLGFTHFKKSFGGTEVSYPGCYTKFRFPL